MEVEPESANSPSASVQPTASQTRGSEALVSVVNPIRSRAASALKLVSYSTELLSRSRLRCPRRFDDLVLVNAVSGVRDIEVIRVGRDHIEPASSLDERKYRFSYCERKHPVVPAILLPHSRKERRRHENG